VHGNSLELKIFVKFEVVTSYVLYNFYPSKTIFDISVSYSVTENNSHLFGSCHSEVTVNKISQIMQHKIPNPSLKYCTYSFNGTYDLHRIKIFSKKQLGFMS